MTTPTAYGEGTYGSHRYGSRPTLPDLPVLTTEDVLTIVRDLDTLPDLAALARPCPYCGTSPGIACTTASGAPAPTHTARLTP